MILFRFLKLFGVDVPGHIAQLQASFEQRVEVAKDEVRQTAQKAAIVAALGAVGGLAALSAAGVGPFALYRWVLENYGEFYGFEAVDGVLIVIAVILFILAFLKARSWWADSVGHDGHEPRRATAELQAPADRTPAADGFALDEPHFMAQSSPQPAHGATSAGVTTTGNPVLDELLFALRGSVKGAADEAVDGVVHTVRYGDQARCGVGRRRACRLAVGATPSRPRCIGLKHFPRISPSRPSSNSLKPGWRSRGALVGEIGASFAQRLRRSAEPCDRARSSAIG